MPVNLRYITQAVHDIDDCHRIWGGMNGGPWFCKVNLTQVFHLFISIKLFNQQEAGGGRDSCNGDSVRFY